MKRYVLLLFLGASLIGAGTWAAVRGYAESNEKKWVVDSETAFKNMYNPQVRGDKIIFSGQTAPYGLDDIFIMNKDGTGLKNLTNTPEKWELYPLWADGGPLGADVGMVYKEFSNIEVRGVNPDNRDFGLGKEPTLKCYFIDIEGKNKRQISEDIFKLYIKK